MMLKPLHPGAMLLDTEIDRRGMSVAEFARRLGVSTVKLANLVRGKTSMTADMALRIAKLTRTYAAGWLAQQCDFDLWEARERLGIGQPRRRDEMIAISGALEIEMLQRIGKISADLSAAKREVAQQTRAKPGRSRKAAR